MALFANALHIVVHVFLYVFVNLFSCCVVEAIELIEDLVTRIDWSSVQLAQAGLNYWGRDELFIRPDDILLNVWATATAVAAVREDQEEESN